MYIETLSNGWELYGKTGSGTPEPNPNSDYCNHSIHDGWFIGFIEKADQKYIFVTNFTDRKKPLDTKSAGIRAKNITKKILADMKLF